MRFDPLPSPLAGMRLWGASAGGYTFIISHEDGSGLAPEDQKEWKGYAASYTNRAIGKPVRIDGLWQTMTAAEQACRDAWKQLRNHS